MRAATWVVRATGIVEPVKAGVDTSVRLGLGKQEEDDEFTNPENITRKKLESEVQANETEERKQRREVGGASALRRGAGAPAA